MANRVTMNICGENYTLIAEESPSYMERVGNLVNEHLSRVMESTKSSRTDAAILAPWKIRQRIPVCLIGKRIPQTEPLEG